ncbi:MAG: pilus assembly protein PilW [Gammaproteobacteria bacterium]|nr:MAG: pilus assembly protein PilW [Gammaproteobacteria bacterium]
MKKLIKLPLPLVLALITSTFVVSACQTGSSNFSKNGYALSKSVNNATDVAKIRTKLAGQYIQSGQLDAAMRQLQLALIADDQYAQAYDMMGVLLQQEGSPTNLQKTDGYFKKAIELADMAQTHNNYGVYLFQVGRYHEALEEFKIAGSTLGYRGRIDALENLGRTYIKLDDKNQAIQTFFKVLENNSNSVIAHIELVDLFIEQKRYKQAKNLLQNTLILFGNRPLPPRVMSQKARLENK